MKILFLCQYYYPEEQNVFVHECALGLHARHYDVTVLTAFPHYGKGAVYEGYRGRVFQRESIDGVPVLRSWVYATPSRTIFRRLMNFVSFSMSALVAGSFIAGRTDAVYVSSPPLFLAITAVFLAKMKRSRLIVHIQDIYPRAAIEHGYLRNRVLIGLAEAVERWIYRRSDRIVVISAAFKRDIIGKGVPSSKVSIVENWADPNFVKVMDRENAFRQQVEPAGRFLVIYSGGLNHNSNLEALIRAAGILRDEGYYFVIVGDGEFKGRLQSLADSLGLCNVRFLPFQPLIRYPEVLAAADINVVSLSPRSEYSSVPSKIYKQLAAGRAILAITPRSNELHQLVSEADCGVCVPPDDPLQIAEALRYAKMEPGRLIEFGRNGRNYFETHHTLEHTMDKLAQTFEAAHVRPEI